MEFDDIIGPLLKREGGYVNHPNDRGGATNMGITQRTYDDFRRKHKLPERNVKDMPHDEAVQVYFEFYWLPSNAPALPEAVREVHFDAAVNHGVGRANKLLQASAGVTQDGAIGPATLSAVFAADPALLFYGYLVARYRFYGEIVRRDKSQLAFIGGWLARMNEFKQPQGA